MHLFDWILHLSVENRLIGKQRGDFSIWIHIRDEKSIAKFSEVGFWFYGMRYLNQWSMNWNELMKSHDQESIELGCVLLGNHFDVWLKNLWKLFNDFI